MTLPIALIVLLAYLVRGMTGFGSGLIAIPLLIAIDTPLLIAVPVVIALDWLGSISQAVRDRAHMAWSEALPLAPWTLVGIGIALLAITGEQSVPIERVFGAVLLVIALYQLLPTPPLSAGRIWAAPAGLLAGFVGTAFGTGGPFTAAYLSARQIEKRAMRATIGGWFVADGGVRLLALAAVGAVGREAVTLFLQLLPIAVAGLLIGGRLHGIVSTQVFRHAISLVLIASGLKLMLV